MHITIRCYGPAREVAGDEFLSLQLPAESTVADALRPLAARSERFAALLRLCVVAVRDEIVPRSYPLTAGDEVALLPPVSGG